MIAPSELVCLAPAKINLGLEVLGRRGDGLHEVATIMQSVSLADRLTFQRAHELVLRCRGMTVDDDNLILRAARRLQDATGCRQGAHITCNKRIPVAAGLGGGSADAAATLRALNTLWDCGLDDAALVALGMTLGADVPFCLAPGTALATGTGRDIVPLPAPPPHWVVIAQAGAEEPEKTARMYRALQTSDFSSGAQVQAQVARLRHSSLDPALLGNAFMRTALTHWPTLSQGFILLHEASAGGCALSGAGPSFYGLFTRRAAARQARELLAQADFPTQLCRTL